MWAESITSEKVLFSVRYTQGRLPHALVRKNQPEMFVHEMSTAVATDRLLTSHRIELNNLSLMLRCGADGRCNSLDEINHVVTQTVKLNRSMTVAELEDRLPSYSSSQVRCVVMSQIIAKTLAANLVCKPFGGNTTITYAG